MKNKIKKLLACLTALVMLAVLSACEKSEEKASEYDSNNKIVKTESGIVSENKNLKLSWDSESYALILESKTTDDIWSTIPYGYYSKNDFEGRAGVLMTSPLNITYYTKGVNQIKSVSGYAGVIKKGRVASEVTEKGIKITYYFDALEISVPVYYELNNDSLEVYTVPAEIEEHDNIVCDVTLSPFLCSAENSKENYVVVPSGSGALMYTDVRGEEQRTYTGEVYGADLSRQVYEKFENLETIRMPVFGAFSGQKGIMGIITNGAESATVSAECGNIETGYSNVYATFSLRGYNVSQVEYSGNITVKNFWAFADKTTSASKCGVTYYLLNGASANYSGMAKRYSEYLCETYKMTDSATDTLLTADIIGGIETKKFMLGIPYYGVTAATTLTDAQEIVKDLSKLTNSLDVRLVGFGKSGLSVREVAGGYKVSSMLGNNKKLKAFAEAFSKYGNNLYFDYDLLRFNKSGNGFSVSSDCVRTVNGYKAEQNVFNIALRDIDENKAGHFILNRKSMQKAVDMLVKKSAINDISLSSLGSVKYSDYTSYDSYDCNNMISDVVSAVLTLKNNGKNVLMDSANDYAAAMANRITNAPTSSSKSASFDIEIPLYQMVFKGYVSLSNTSVNMAENTNRQLLKCVESGSGISYTLIANYSTLLAQTGLSHFTNALYEDNSTNIATNIEKYEEFFNQISSAKILNHSIITEDVRVTDFDNGFSVYVNYGDFDYTLGDTKIPSEGFVFQKGR